MKKAEKCPKADIGSVITALLVVLCFVVAANFALKAIFVDGQVITSAEQKCP